MEDLKSCRICGKLFEANKSIHVCPSCVANEDPDFIMIREYLYERPRASIYEVASVLGITINKIKHLLREGRIEIVEKDNQFLTCEICGKPIQSGKFCDDCYRHGGPEPKGIYTGGSSNLKDSPQSNKQETKLNFYSKGNNNYKK